MRPSFVCFVVVVGGGGGKGAGRRMCVCCRVEFVVGVGWLGGGGGQEGESEDSETLASTQSVALGSATPLQQNLQLTQESKPTRQPQWNI